jgi:hypothetical protein
MDVGGHVYQLSTCGCIMECGARQTRGRQMRAESVHIVKN